jgi:hypothetical protein
MSTVRLRYTGLVAYSVSLTTMLTGLLFTVLITRRLSPEELGVWRYIGALINYFVVPAWLMGFWITRMTARGLRPIATSLLLAAPTGLGLHGPLHRPLALLLRGHRLPGRGVLVASIEIPLIYLYTLLESAANAVRPQTNYYAQLAQEVVKLPIGLVLVLALRLGLVGALWSAIAGFAARAAVLALVTRSMGWGTPSRQIASTMLSRYWLPLYAAIPPNVIALDNVIVALIYGSAEPLGYAAAAYLLGSVVVMSGNLAAGLYPRMLQSPSPRDVEVALKMVLMIAIPSSVGISILSAPLLNVLRPEYAEAAWVMPALQLGAIVSLLLGIMDYTIVGEERADYDERSDFRRLLRSRLFLIPTLNYFYALVYLPALYLALTLLGRRGPVEVLWVWVLTSLAASAGLLVYKVRLAVARVPFRFPKEAVSKYLAATLVMAAVLLLAKPDHLPERVFDALATALWPVSLSALTYFSALYLLDREFRQLVAQILEALRLWGTTLRRPSSALSSCARR